MPSVWNPTDESPRQDPPERGGAPHRVPAAGRAQAVAFPLDAGRVVVVAEFGPFVAGRADLGDPDGKIGVDGALVRRLRKA
jgi:hypothetical protein